MLPSRSHLQGIIERKLAEYARDPMNNTPNPSSVWITPAAQIAVDAVVEFGARLLAESQAFIAELAAQDDDGGQDRTGAEDDG